MSNRMTPSQRQRLSVEALAGFLHVNSHIVDLHSLFPGYMSPHSFIVTTYCESLADAVRIASECVEVKWSIDESDSYLPLLGSSQDDIPVVRILCPADTAGTLGEMRDLLRLLSSGLRKAQEIPF